MRGSRCARIGAGAAVVLLACVATGLASATLNYASRSRTKPPYLFMTLGNGKVVKVRWDIYEVCARNGNDFQKSANTLKAPIRNGHFSKRVTYQIFPEPSFLSTIDVTTTVSGTITGKTAKVKVSDTRRSFETGKCSGSHKFTVREVPG